MRRKFHAPLALFALLSCSSACTSVDPPKQVSRCTQNSECATPQVCDVERQRCVGSSTQGSSQMDAGEQDAAVASGGRGAGGTGGARDRGRDAGRGAEPSAADGGEPSEHEPSGGDHAGSGGQGGQGEPASTDAGSCKREAERCDDLDNDCDQHVDEGLSEGCGSNEGECRPGTRSCEAGAWSACKGELLPQPELCDGLDNDCNGKLDDAVSCELHWQRVTDSAGPTKREQSAYGYDSDRRLFVIHGGFANNMGTADTWAFDVSANTWSRLSDTGPSPRRDHAMVYDSTRKRFVLFGGFSGDAGLRDTWELDGQTWSERMTDHGPPNRSLHAMVYDTTRQRVVMFGGFSDNQVTGETWEYDGADWQERAISGPSARRSPALTYDSENKRTLLFGGTPEWGSDDSTTTGFNDLWAYDGGSWQQLSAANTPRPRWFSSLVWHPKRKVAFLYGGVQMQTNLSDTYELDGSNWIDRTGGFGAPEFSYSAAIIYDPVGERLLTFGGTTAANEHTDAVWALK